MRLHWASLASEIYTTRFHEYARSTVTEGEKRTSSFTSRMKEEESFFPWWIDSDLLSALQKNSGRTKLFFAVITISEKKKFYIVCQIYQGRKKGFQLMHSPPLFFRYVWPRYGMCSFSGISGTHRLHSKCFSCLAPWILDDFPYGADRRWKANEFAECYQKRASHRIALLCVRSVQNGWWPLSEHRHLPFTVHGLILIYLLKIKILLLRKHAHAKGWLVLDICGRDG